MNIFHRKHDHNLKLSDTQLPENIENCSAIACPFDNQGCRLKYEQYTRWLAWIQFLADHNIDRTFVEHNNPGCARLNYLACERWKKHFQEEKLQIITR